MSDQVKKTVEDKTPEQFLEAYQNLSKEYGYQLVITPAWKARDDGTWSTVLQVSVGKLPSEAQ